MLARTRRFLKDVVCAAWLCVSEEPGTLVPAILITLVFGLLWLAFDMVLEGDAADVASRLASLSINPNNWV
jgi:hypothetical protein